MPGFRTTRPSLLVRLFEFKVPDNRVVLVPLKAAAKKPVAGSPVDVSGQAVDSQARGRRQCAGHPEYVPNHRYRQEALQIKTEGQRKFRFDRFTVGKDGRAEVTFP